MSDVKPEVTTVTQPVSGSSPFQFSWDDAKHVLITAVLVGLSAAVTFALESVIPSVQSSSPFVIILLPVLTVLLKAVQRWLMDTRALEIKKSDIVIDDKK